MFDRWADEHRRVTEAIDRLQSFARSHQTLPAGFDERMDDLVQRLRELEGKGQDGLKPHDTRTPAKRARGGNER